MTTSQKHKGENKMEKRIVDFQNNPDAEYEIGQAFARTGATKVDWIQKDYGMVIFCQIEPDQEKEFDSRIGNIHGVTY